MSSGVVTVLVDLGYLLGAVAVGVGLLAAHRGERVPRAALLVAGAVAVLTALVPPLGSADHLSYAAYGRIAAQGGDPYVVPPSTWAGGRDPVASAVEPPWTTTPSIYGPVATAVQAVASGFGGDSLRATVWAWQLVCLVAWLATGVLLLRLAGRLLGTRDRAAWVWLLNPVLYAVLLLGAHVDLLGAALGLAALALAGRRALLAGALLGAAVGVKITFALLGPAVLYALWRRDRLAAWRPAALGLLGSLLVLVPAQLWAGSHVFDQLSRARRFVSLATPWRPFVDWLTGPLPSGAVRTGVEWLTPLVVLALVVALWSLVRPDRVGAAADDAPDAPPDVTLVAAAVTVVLGTAYVLGTPYSLPWYDALAWAPLALVAVPALDAVLLVRLAAYGVAYVPGRVVGISPDVQDLTLGYRRQVAPWIGLALLLTVAWASRRPRRPAARAR